MIKRIFRLSSLALLIASLLWNVSSAAALQTSTFYYVSPSGNDSNVGTESAPFKTISKAINAAKAGDTIYVRAGTYPAFTVSKSGLKILAYPNERPLISGGLGVWIKANDVLFSGFEVANMTGDHIAGITSRGNNNIIENNIVHDIFGLNSSGIAATWATGGRIAGNVAYSTSFFGIGVYKSTGITVSGNVAYDNVIAAGDADGIHCSQSSGNIFTNNTVYGNSDDGLDTWDCPSNIVSNNIAYRNGGTGDGNGFKLGFGGLNTVTDNLAYENFTCGFTSNGGGNYYENNVSRDNGDCGFEDDWRASGNTQPSQFINNRAWGNRANFRTGQYTVTFEGNSEASPQSQTPPSTSTSTPEPAVTPTATPTGIIATATEITPTPLAETPVFTSTFTVTPPALPSGTYVLTSVDLDTLLVGQTGSVSVSLNGLPAEGIASVEFACTYASDQVSIGNVQIGQIFGDDPVSAYNNSQNGSFIYAVAASNGRVINTNGVAFTFSITGLQPGSSSVECKANISRANQPLESIASVPDSLTVTLQSAPTATPLSPPTPLPPPMLTGKVIASKPVTINLFNPDMTLAGTAKANPDGTFNLIAPAGTFTVVASAEGYLSAQGSVTLSEGATTTLDPITLPAGDIDNNSVIDQYDALTVGMNYNVSAALPADLSNDGLINVMDLEMLAENYRMAGLLSWQQP